MRAVGRRETRGGGQAAGGGRTASERIGGGEPNEQIACWPSQGKEMHGPHACVFCHNLKLELNSDAWMRGQVDDSAWLNSDAQAESAACGFFNTCVHLQHGL